MQSRTGNSSHVTPMYIDIPIRLLVSNHSSANGSLAELIAIRMCLNDMCLNPASNKDPEFNLLDYHSNLLNSHSFAKALRM